MKITVEVYPATTPALIEYYNETVRLNTLEFSNHMGLQWSGFKFKPFSARQNNN